MIKNIIVNAFKSGKSDYTDRFFKYITNVFFSINVYITNYYIISHVK